MIIFNEKVWAEYPIPFSVSIWGEIALEDLTQLIKSCVDEVASDVATTGYIKVSSTETNMPEDCREVLSVKLDMGFQGNRFVKSSYDRETNMLYLRAYPALVKYRKSITEADLDSLKGDTLIYVKNYVLSKMATKELVMLGSINLDADNSEIDLSLLQSFRDSCDEKVKELKPEILMYGNSR